MKTRVVVSGLPVLLLLSAAGGAAASAPDPAK